MTHIRNYSSLEGLRLKLVLLYGESLAGKHGSPLGFCGVDVEGSSPIPAQLALSWGQQAAGTQAPLN